MKKIRILLSLAWSISPTYILLLVMNALIGSGQILANVILPKYLIDELTLLRRSEQLIFWVGAIVVCNLVFGFLAKFMKRTLEVKNQYMDMKINQALGIKIMNVDFAYLENPYYLDLKERASFACTHMSAVYNLISGSTETLKSLITLVGLLTVMLTLGPVLFIISGVAIILSVLLMRSFSSFQVSFFQELIPINRRYAYYLMFGFDNKGQKDFRLYQMAPLLTNRVISYAKEFMGQFNQFYKKRGKITGITNVITNLHAALTYGYVGLRVLTDRFGSQIWLGSFTMYVNASIQFTTGFRALSDNIISMKQMFNYLEPFVEMMELPEVGQEGNIPFSGEVESIAFEHLSFAYPNSDKEVLSDISFEIKKGEKISIVGLNGAGKTTLIKLICRLYHPSAGRILINGRNIFEYDYESYVRSLAAVFQDFKLFAFSLRENITSQDKGVEDTAGLLRIIEEAGIREKIQELPNGLDSLYGKSYDEEGVELSGGQSQKIAIARALYKDASLVILDEPTSALDPLAEADIYQNFNQMVKNKTAIYISHRMSSSVFCDRILVLDGGKISDFDSHENLMKKGDSLYCKLFRAQAENYQGA